MALNFSPSAQAALALAKRCVPAGGMLDIPGLMAAVCHQTEIAAEEPEAAAALDRPVPLRADSDAPVPVAPELQEVFRDLHARGEEITPRILFTELAVRGAFVREVSPVKAQPVWKSSPERQQAIRDLAAYGRMLTDAELPYRGLVEMDAALESLIITLSTSGRKNAIITGYPGTGKSALIYEFARQLAAGGETIPAHLREFDIFELSPAFLRAGASLAGEYDQRVKTLLEILKRNPKIILFVDEIHSLLRSGMHEKGPFSEANETIKSALSRGEIICIGCTTTAEFRHYIQPDAALMRRFVEIPLRPPSAEAATRILRARLPRLEKHYAPFRVPDAMLASVVALTDQYLPARQQPDKSIQILDRACARSVTAKPRRSELGEADLLRAIEDVVGYPLLRGSSLTEESVYTALAAKIVGQDETLHAIARAFVAGLGGWMKKTCPRAVLLFSGPTGVGKTETAVALGAILGRGRAGLIRIDCNTLAGSGLDSGPALNRLLGAPPGYIGYSRGQGGLLSRVRDEPESVVLFDEIEKADPGVGKLLLQILDSGRVDDAEGNTLDFRRSFLVFTTNAGCVYESRRLGFGETGGGPNPVPLVDQEKLQRDFHAAGFGPEFLARIGHIFEFRSLDASGIRTIIQSHLKGLLELAGARGFAFEWDARVEELLASEWQSRFGVRHLKTILTNRITEQLSVAEAQGELRGVTRIRLRVLALDGNAANLDFTGAATHERAEENLIIKLA